ncbi:MAG: cytochrome c-type biogenesis protein CcmH [Solirubrobacterales bacterium]
MIRHLQRRCTRLLATTLLLFAVVAPVAAACPLTSLPAIEDEVMCPICGVPLVNAGGPQAENEREFIRERVERCDTKDEVKNALIAEYGEEVLAMPGDEGFDLAAYLVPIALIGIGAVGVGVGALRWRRNRDQAVATTAASGPNPNADDALDKDLQRYDL